MKKIFQYIFLQIITFCLLTTTNPVNAKVRPSVVSGTFYPSDSVTLADMVNKHLKQVEEIPKIDGQLVALIVPHAGLIYSGQIAAYSYKLLENSNIENVILCGPSHRVGFDGISVYGPDINWQTPFGGISCNDSLCDLLISNNKNITVYPEAHSQEHSLEVQLPYIKTVLPNCRIVPVVMGYQQKRNIDILADALENIEINDKTIMIASTDWQHYKPASVGQKMDSLAIDCLEKLDGDRLLNLLTTNKAEMCGGGPTVAVMKAAVTKGANKVKILKYGDSGDVTGDKSSVVSYVAAVIYKSSVSEHKTDNKSEYKLSVEEKRKLLEIARTSIESRLSDKAIPTFEVSGILQEPGAAFVTLNKNGHLRGCIGYTMPVMELYKSISECAVKAAVEDPRFPTVQLNELSSIEIEISVLTPLRKVESLDEIKVGRDGLMITKGFRRGLLLPQVATEYNWDRKKFLEQTCLKAGLPINSYKSPDAEIYRFQAYIFNEKEINE